MGAFFYISKQTNPTFEHLLEKGRKQLALGGFRTRTTFETHASVIDYYSKIDNPVDNYVAFPSGEFIFSVGTFLYSRRTGKAALREFFAVDDSEAALRAAQGHFILVLRKNNRTLLLTDVLGSYQVYHTRNYACVTTSFLAAAAVSGACTVSTHETYEYVFNGVTLGNATPFQEILQLDLLEYMQFDPEPRLFTRPPIVILPEKSAPAFQLVRCNLQKLSTYAETIRDLFGDNIRLPLSGGYDSRLLLALFRRAGVTPRLFVYGNSAGADVRTAQRIAAAEGFVLDHIDKAYLRRADPGQYADVVESNFHSEDGLHPHGIFDTGVEIIARRWRGENGALHVSGGGGEIYRNFFYLPDRSMKLEAFVKVFYSGFDPAQCSSLFSSREHRATIEAKIRRLVRETGKSISRRSIESLYPFFRCRSWFGRDISINNRWGYSIVPFMDHEIVTEALRIPIRYKHFGNFESALIRAADAALAGYTSNYGHDFSRGAPWWAVANWRVQYARPPWLRSYAFRVKSRLRGRDRLPAPLSPACLKPIIGTGFPYMSRFFDIERVTSAVHFARICNLEYLCQRFSAR